MLHVVSADFIFCGFRFATTCNPDARWIGV
jgi:hypothetical protein